MNGRWAGRARLFVAGVVLLGEVLGGTYGRAAAQEAFRVTWEVDRSNPARTRVIGHVLNEARFDALDVYVTAEALDGRGKVVARGIAFVGHRISQGGSAPFAATVLAPPGATTIRVHVSSFRAGLGAQSP